MTRVPIDCAGVALIETIMLATATWSNSFPVHQRCKLNSLVVIAQEPAEPLATPHTSLPTRLRDPREQQHVGLSLMIPFTVVVRNLFMQRPTQRALTKEED